MNNCERVLEGDHIIFRNGKGSLSGKVEHIMGPVIDVAGDDGCKLFITKDSVLKVDGWSPLMEKKRFGETDVDPSALWWIRN